MSRHLPLPRCKDCGARAVTLTLASPACAACGCLQPAITRSIGRSLERLLERLLTGAYSSAALGRRPR